MAINQLNKYVWLVETIHRAKKRGGITLKEIQSRWLDSDLSEGTELSRRTFINNIHSIEELFEINIECGSGYRYNIEYGDCFDEGSTRCWMLNAFSLHAMVGNSRKLKERVLLEDMPSGRNFLEDIIKAMRDNHVIITAKPKAHAFKNEMCFPLTKTKCELKKHPNSKFECFFNDFNRTRTSLFLPFPSKLIQDNLVCVLELQE